MVDRRTIIVRGRFAQSTERLAAARRGEQGVGVLTIEQMAARLAGGFSRLVDDETLKTILRTVLPQTGLGELDPIKDLPGMVAAAAATLRKAWHAGVPLSPCGEIHQRLVALRSLETAVVGTLPNGCMRPGDLAELASTRLRHASAVLGPVTIVGIADLPPCWRELVRAVAAHVPVTWVAGPCRAPDWVTSAPIHIERSAAANPVVSAFSSATPRHEALEALRWARQLMASGRARPEEIAIVACRTSDYDDVILALRSEANLDIRFVHGVPVASVREGQTAAALADVLVRGLSQDGVRRLAALCRGGPGLLGALPQGWTRILPRAAPLAGAQAWQRLFAAVKPEEAPDVAEQLPILREAISLLARGTEAAAEAGERLLGGLPLHIWRRALIEGSSASIDLTIANLRLDDEGEQCAGVVWAPAAAIASSPRPFVRLLGLSSRGWPQAIMEDRLLPDHVVPLHILDPAPRPVADRGDFDAILATSTSEVALSRPRRGPDGRLLGESPLIQTYRDREMYLGRNRIPQHAVGQVDRLTARPDEFRAIEQSKSAASCWTAWAESEVTKHDGRIRPNHPIILAILERTHSATSLEKLLRDPAGFVWTYGLGMRTVDSSAEPIVLDASAYGMLLHQVLEHAVEDMEASDGFAGAAPETIRHAVAAAVAKVEAAWQSDLPVPPDVVWQRTLDDVAETAFAALTHPESVYDGQRSWVEVPFGGQVPKSASRAMPWDGDTVVTIPTANFRIAGYIDRLDLAGDRSCARVRDYKSRKAPEETISLDGGRELQRCLYGYAARALLGTGVSIDASLLFPRDGVCHTLENADGVLDALGGHLAAARESLRLGRAFAGPDAEEKWNDLLFALPANALRMYGPRKRARIREELAAAADIWDVV
ncbi:RecB family exonuclease [Methylobacterium sp. BE186]|uniref:PD-(D/E)XK nuclease family protein n=1 Tax=Methylobacterium sp. BE186 TaxID=2817715 RepID=UPI0028543FB7|nr:PD-(D/E)XK nuclease family protein [Methylobacterium sp. BE186]MDR7037978.1 RecB family exonuclease [Methylobacterium sp. BE186]